MEELIKCRITFDTGNLKSIGGSMGQQASNQGKGSSALAVGAMAGVAAAATTAVLETLKKIWEAIKEASPRLQATISIFRKTFELMIRPIGDAVGMFLRPMAIQFLLHAVKFYKMAVNSPFFNSLLKPEEKRTPAEKAKILAVEQGVGAATGAAVGMSMGGLPGAALGAAAGFAVASLGKAWEGIKNIATIIGALRDKFTEIGIEFDIWVNEKLGKITAWFDSNVIEPIKEAWLPIANWLNDNVITPIKEAWSPIGDWIDLNVIAPIKTAWATVTNWFDANVIIPIKEAWATVTNWFDANVIQPIKDAWSGFVNWIKNVFDMNPGHLINNTKKVGDAIITPGGKVIQTDPRDTLIATKNPGAIGSGNISVSVYALDPSSINPATLNKISQAVQQAMKSGLSRRTTEAIGVC